MAKGRTVYLFYGLFSRPIAPNRATAAEIIPTGKRTKGGTDMKNEKKPGVMLYFELEPLLREMHPEDGYALILAILAYARCGTPPQFSSAALNYAWAFVRAGIDRDDARYSHVVEQRRKAAEKRWSKRTDASDEDTFAALACK